MQVHFNTDGGSRSALVVACSESVKALAWRFARGSSRLDVDDLYSVGMVEVCEAVAAGRGLDAENPVAYLCGVARFAMCDEWRRVHSWSTASLDAPLTDHTHSSTLCDVLVAPTALAPVVSERERALHDALGQLSARQRAVLRRRFGLEQHGATSRRQTGEELRTSESNVKSLQRRGVAALRADAQLCQALGVEVER